MTISGKPRDDSEPPKLDESGEQPLVEFPESYTRETQHLVEEARVDIENVAYQSGTRPLLGSPRFFDTLVPPPFKEGRVDFATLNEVSKLLRDDSYESHKAAQLLLEAEGLQGVQGWQVLHLEGDPDKRHELSRPEKTEPNDFARQIPRRFPLQAGQILLELGCGRARETIFFGQEFPEAHIIGVDGTQEVIESGTRRIEALGLNDRVAQRVQLGRANYLDVLRFSQGMGVDITFSFSTLHYFLSRVIKQEVSPLLAGALRSRRRKSPHGVLCVAMKTADSASARSPEQLKLLRGDEYDTSVHTGDKMVRIYPKNLNRAVELFEADFDVVEANEVIVPDYDRKNDDEKFAQMILRPKARARRRSRR